MLRILMGVQNVRALVVLIHQALLIVLLQIIVLCQIRVQGKIIRTL